MMTPGHWTGEMRFSKGDIIRLWHTSKVLKHPPETVWAGQPRLLVLAVWAGQPRLLETVWAGQARLLVVGKV